MFRKWHNDDRKVGLYATVSFHLVLLIILLLVTIKTVVDQESSFVLDFTKQEELEAEQREIEFKESISKELDEQIGNAPEKIRNTVVDAGSRLKDDRFRNPKELYDEARELQKKLDASRKDALAQEKALEEAVELGKEKKAEEHSPKASSYSGPSVISYRLDGRKARSLPVPAYKGYGAGDVSVAIVVNGKGRVIAAKVIEEDSTGDTQLWDFALKAAKSSVFNASESAPDRQLGEIVYRFVRQ